MQLYGYDLPTTPNLNAYARRAVVFENAYCTATNTDPSLTAIFTGKYPCVTGIHNHGARTTRSEIQRAERLQYLTEILRDNGFWTGAVDVSDRWHRKGFCEYLYQTKSNMYGLGSIGNEILDSLHAYDFFFTVLSKRVPPKHLPPANLRAEDVTDNAIRLIRKWGNRRNFLFVHYWDTHTPYVPPQDFLRQFLVPRNLGPLARRTPLDIVGSFKHPFRKPIDVAWLRKLPSIEYALAAYDGAVAHVDQEIGRLLLEVENQGQSDRTIVVLTSDHGESLLEHGVFFDHHSLYEPVVKVPFVFLMPDQLLSCLKRGRIASCVSHVDLFPTLLGLAEIPYDLRKLNGLNCLPAMRGEGTKGVERPILMEESHFERKRAIRLGRYKLIQSLDEKFQGCRFCGRAHGDRTELFDLETDPHETKNLSTERPDLLIRVSALLDSP
jgi:arylsulfatase A-like enzyme